MNKKGPAVEAMALAKERNDCVEDTAAPESDPDVEEEEVMDARRTDLNIMTNIKRIPIISTEYPAKAEPNATLPVEHKLMKKEITPAAKKALQIFRNVSIICLLYVKFM